MKSHYENLGVSPDASAYCPIFSFVDWWSSHASMEVELFAEYTFEYPVKKHHRRRIQKKWLKRYGTKREYYRTSITTLRDISPPLKKESISVELLLELTARCREFYQAQPDRPLRREDCLKPDEIPKFIEIKKTRYEFPVVRAVQRVQKNAFFSESFLSQFIDYAKREFGAKATGMAQSRVIVTEC